MKKQVGVEGAVLVEEMTVLAARRSEQMSLPSMRRALAGGSSRGDEPEGALALELVEELLRAA